MSDLTKHAPRLPFRSADREGEARATLQNGIQRRLNWLAWIAVPTFFVMMFVAGGTSLFTASAVSPASLSPLSGHYEFRGITTSGPHMGIYITGQVEMLAADTTIQGHICGLAFNFNHSRCATISGTTDGENVSFTIGRLVMFPSLSVTGKFFKTLSHKNCTGFSGTFTMGTGTSVSTGSWIAYSSPVPSIAGKWNFYSVVQRGLDRGQQMHGILVLVQQPNDMYIGTYCTLKGSCVPVKGTNLYSYLRIYLGNPATMVLRGTYTLSEGHVASGQFYTTDRHSGDKGYWLLHATSDSSNS